jgi:hypothetical protein
VLIQRLRPEEINELRDDDYEFILSGSSNIPDLFEINRQLALRDQVRNRFPSCKTNLVAKGCGGNNYVYNALEHVFSIVMGLKSHEFPEPESFVNPEGSKDVLGYIEGRVASELHSVGSERDARFKEWLSHQHTKGNIQSSQKETFLIVSDRSNGGGKFNFVGIDSDFSGINFSDYVAVLLDNSDTDDSEIPRIGRGINALERIVEVGRGIPVLYQTAHEIEEFSDSDRRRIEQFPNTYLVPKNSAVKISNSRKVAVKEVCVGRILEEDLLLSRYSVHPIMLGEDGYIRSRGKFITMSRAAPVCLASDPYKRKLFNELGLEETVTNHKMYVLSAFHTNLKHEILNPSLELVGSDFFEFERIRQRLTPILGETEIESLKEPYESVVFKHKSYDSRVLTHNDAKEDNWFGGEILGDYGSVCPGREYKDIARALIDLDGIKTTDREYVDSAIRAYYSLRGMMDGDLMEEGIESYKEFKERVYEMIFCESLRLSQFKSQTNREHAINLFRIASSYKPLLQDILH